jgi:hypothetical protein
VFKQIIPNNRTGEMKKSIHPTDEGKTRAVNPNGKFA